VASGLDALERTVLEVALELLDGGAGDSDRWQALIGEFGSEGALDVALTIVWWDDFVPTMPRAMGLEADR
jgi:hypothetical protein